MRSQTKLKSSPERTSRASPSLSDSNAENWELSIAEENETTSIARSALQQPPGQVQGAAHVLRGTNETLNMQNQITFLLVDDSGPSRKMLQRVLTLCKELPIHKVFLEADDGDTGVAELQRAMACGQRVDCVLLDFTMVRMHGPEAASLMRRQVGYIGLIVAVTGNVLAADRQKLLDSGVDHVLHKPMPKDQLITILHNRGIL
jgi:CheY-like chemotaxis protein